MPAKRHVTIYTDGSCSGNPGPGGWGALLQFESPTGVIEKELSGGEPLTTNNRMELQAALEALTALSEPCRVSLHSDSSYVVNAFNKGWIKGWKKRGWKTSAKKPVLNQDIWKPLIEAASVHEVAWIWVKGHAGHAENERVDQLAVRAMQQWKAD
jgi:ribonuclease HI